MAAERDGDPRDRDPDEIGELVDEFGDRSGPASGREPEVEPLTEDEPIVEPARDEPDEP